MRYEVLGPLRVVKDGEVLGLSARKMEIVLAALLIRADQVVSVEQLITEVWGGSRPRRVHAALYVYISQLRKMLGAGSPSPIVTRAPGYLLRTGTDEFDLHVFQRLADEGRAHARDGRHEEARAAFAAALGLWRGPALGELREGPIINGFAIWLEENRLECNELLVESSLRLGRHRELVSGLQRLIGEHPLHEAFYRQLMLALWRCERRADALTVYQTARTTLSRELGLEPGIRLRELQRSILASGEGARLRAAV